MADTAQDTLQQQKQQRRRDIEQNRAAGVIEVAANEKAVADDPGMRRTKEVWEVEEGALHIDGKRLGPGHRFNPTARQLEQTRRGKGGLLGKARELTASEMDGLGRSSRRVQSTGADIGLRSLPMDKDARERAFEVKLTEEDFRGMQPVGRGGRFTLQQVEDLIALKQSADQN